MIPLSNLERLQLRIGFHEAGHVAAALHFGIELKYVTMDYFDNAGELGGVQPDFWSYAKATTEEKILLCLCGPIADCRYRNARFNVNDPLFSGDIAQLVQLGLIRQWLAETIATKYQPKAEALAGDYWPQITRLAQHIARLERGGRLEAAEIMAIWRDGQKI